MKAAVFYEPHVPVIVEEIDLDEPKAGEVLVDLVGAGVCHSDYHFVDGHLSQPSVPYVMGHEGGRHHSTGWRWRYKRGPRRQDHFFDGHDVRPLP